MRDEFAEYRENLKEGLRIEVGIPLAGGGVFRDWAIVQAAHDDEIVAQISRDMLPLNVKVDVGTILDVSVWKNKDVYSCSSIVMERISSRRLKIRLFGAFTLRERRQSFRMELELRVRYARVDEGAKPAAQADWERRLELERMKFQGYDNFVIAAQTVKFSPSVQVEWHDVPRTSLNLGGGGILLRLPERLPMDGMVNLEIHLPAEPLRIVHCVAQVVHQREPRTPKDAPTFHGTGFEFLFLDERDRDLIFRYISARQIEYLRERAKRLTREVPVPESAPRQMTRRDMVRRTLGTVLILALCALAVYLLIRYQRTAPPNEIGKTYEKALREYRKIAPSPGSQ